MTNIAIIDIGSNSVRIRISSGDKVVYRDMITTQLSKDMEDGMLSNRSIIRTLDGLELLIAKAKEYNAEVYAFATAAVRNSQNGNEFVQLFYYKFGITIDVVNGEKESELGIIGALDGNDGTVIDVGGASSEIAVRINGDIVYEYSLNLGAVTLTDIQRKNYEEAADYVRNIMTEYGDVPVHDNVYLIGGTATSVAFMLSHNRVYDREKNNGKILKKEDVEKLTKNLFELSPEKIVAKYHINEKRASIIHSGALLILSIMEYLGIDKAVVSENDNLEGYYKTIVRDNDER